MSSRTLADLITAMRASRRFNERSEVFLNSLLVRARRQSTVSMARAGL